MFFTIILSLIPLLFDLFAGNISTWKEFWGNGQVLLIGVALGAESIGELISFGTTYNTLELSVIGTNFITIICSCLMYPVCSNTTSRVNQLRIKPEVLCFCLFTTSLVTSISCKLITISKQVN